MKQEYVGIGLLDNPYFLDRCFDYFVPCSMHGKLSVGDVVIVPFGTANQPRFGIVLALKEHPEEGQLTKPVLSVCPKELSLNEELLGLALFMKEQTLCTLGDALRAISPALALSRLEEVYLSIPNANECTDPSLLPMLTMIREQGQVRPSLLNKEFGKTAPALLKKLLAGGWIQRDFEIKLMEEKTEPVCRLAIDRSRADAILKGIDPSCKLRSAAHLTVLRYLFDSAESELRERTVCDACNVSSAQITALCQKGILRRERRMVDRSLMEGVCADPKPLVLNEEQETAYQTLRSLTETGEPHAALLHGVTGSGKTSVMMKLIDHVLEAGRGVILLLPEIALTPQTLSIFCSRYGERVAILHSGLSVGEKLDAHRRIRRGGADVVIGTRSAVFAPLPDLGLIIIDEEQEHTYKSDMNPKYHARDVARYRCTQHKALMLLASATPSFESFYKARRGIYTLVSLKHRYGGAKLPRVTIADLRSDLGSASLSPIGNLLCARLTENQKKGNQSVLFLNRRGYHNFVSCRSCGEAVLCPRCSVSMTYHTLGHTYQEAELRCHWCGQKMPVPKECPSCKSEHLARMGFGTQRVEQEITSMLPDARVLRMDADATVSRDSYEEMLGTFRRHEADVLLGTQMVTKGHDFPDVTLVGVLSADAALYLDDYRAAERTFSMLTQVIGRAGRGEKEGEAIIQTHNPNHECIRLACNQDYEAFFDAEIRLRKELVFPPFCDMVTLTLTSPIESELLRASERLSELLSESLSTEYTDVPTVIYGPFEAPVYKVENKYRMKTVIKCRLNRRSRALFSYLLSVFSQHGVKELSLSVDFNPTTL